MPTCPCAGTGISWLDRFGDKMESLANDLDKSVSKLSAKVAVPGGSWWSVDVDSVPHNHAMLVHWRCLQRLRKKSTALHAGKEEPASLKTDKDR